MSTIDLTLPDFLRAENRKPPLQTQRRRTETKKVMARAGGRKSKQRSTTAVAKAEINKDH